MGKFILFSLNLIFLATYQFFFGGEVIVKQEFPSDIKAGEKFTIEVMITKGEREGFAKWQQDLPKGFTATAVETAGATFSFKKNTVKLIWMALPDEGDFTVSYEVEADAGMNGEFDLVGKFSYIEENERKDISTDAKKINVGFGDGALAVKEESKTEEETPEVPVKKEEKADIIEMSEPKEVDKPTQKIDKAFASFSIDKRVTSNEDIKVERNIKVKGNGIYEVSLIIDKQNFQSFGKVEEYIPNGYVASSIENDQGMYSFNNNVMKVLWMAMPPKSTLEVKYRLESTNDELDSATVHGVFSYLKGEESVQLAMSGSSFPNTFSKAEEQMASKTEANEVEEVAESKPIMAEVPEVTQKEIKKEEKVKEVTSIPAPETGVSYRVQIAAGKKEVKPEYFVQRHGIREEITTDYHNSWFKYMIGSFGVYKEARDKRNQVWAADNKITDAFVTAYNSGERISVQEALMITKQKWYK